jgi:L-asparaginase
MMAPWCATRSTPAPRGLAIDAVGAGNVNAAVSDAVKHALAKKTQVVIASRVYDGAVEPIYGGRGGRKTLLDQGRILAGDLIGGKAGLLLTLSIAEYGNDAKQLTNLFRLSVGCCCARPSRKPRFLS